MKRIRTKDSLIHRLAAGNFKGLPFGMVAKIVTLCEYQSLQRQIRIEPACHDRTA